MLTSVRHMESVTMYTCIHHTHTYTHTEMERERENEKEREWQSGSENDNMQVSQRILWNQFSPPLHGFQQLKSGHKAFFSGNHFYVLSHLNSTMINKQNKNNLSVCPFTSVIMCESLPGMACGVGRTFSGFSPDFPPCLRQVLLFPAEHARLLGL